MGKLKHKIFAITISCEGTRGLCGSKMESDVGPPTVAEEKKWDSLSDKILSSQAARCAPPASYPRCACTSCTWDSFVRSTGHGMYCKQNIPFSWVSTALPNCMGRLLQSVDLGQSHGAGF